MERSAAYKWAGHVVPGSWLDWEDHMAHAGEEGDGAGVGVGAKIQKNIHEPVLSLSSLSSQCFLG